MLLLRRRPEKAKTTQARTRITRGRPKLLATIVARSNTLVPRVCPNCPILKDKDEEADASTRPVSLRNMILLDDQLTVDLLCNHKLVSQARWKTDESMTVHGNGGTLTTNMKAHVQKCGDVWFDTNAITMNILSLKNVCEKLRVTWCFCCARAS